MLICTLWIILYLILTKCFRNKFFSKSYTRQSILLLQALKLLHVADLKPYVIFIKPPAFNKLKQGRNSTNAKSSAGGVWSQGFQVRAETIIDCMFSFKGVKPTSSRTAALLWIMSFPLLPFSSLFPPLFIFFHLFHIPLDAVIPSKLWSGPFSCDMAVSLPPPSLIVMSLKWSFSNARYVCFYLENVNVNNVQEEFLIEEYEE